MGEGGGRPEPSSGPGPSIQLGGLPGRQHSPKSPPPALRCLGLAGGWLSLTEPKRLWFLVLSQVAALVGCPSKEPKDLAARFALMNQQDFLGLRVSFIPGSEPPSFQDYAWHSSHLSPDFISRVLQGKVHWWCSMKRPSDLGLGILWF